MSSTVIFLIFIPVLSLLLLSVNLILAPHMPYKEKKTPFECGYHSFLWQNRTQFTILFFIFGIAFLLFDVEVVLIYPFALSSYSNNIYGLIVLTIFALVVTIGFVFELGKKALTIESKQSNLKVILTRIEDRLKTVYNLSFVRMVLLTVIYYVSKLRTRVGELLKRLFRVVFGLISNSSSYYHNEDPSASDVLILLGYLVGLFTLSAIASTRVDITSVHSIITKILSIHYTILILLTVSFIISVKDVDRKKLISKLELLQLKREDIRVPFQTYKQEYNNLRIPLKAKKRGVSLELAWLSKCNFQYNKLYNKLRCNELENSVHQYSIIACDIIVFAIFLFSLHKLFLLFEQNTMVMYIFSLAGPADNMNLLIAITIVASNFHVGFCLISNFIAAFYSSYCLLYAKWF